MADWNAGTILADTGSGAAAGASVGSLFSPYGTAIGGVIGAGVGLLGGVELLPQVHNRPVPLGDADRHLFATQEHLGVDGVGLGESGGVVLGAWRGLLGYGGRGEKHGGEKG